MSERPTSLDALPDPALVIDLQGAIFASNGLDVADALARVVGEISFGEGAPDLTLSASVGVADFSSGTVPSVEELLASADSAMYVSKRAARDERPA